MDGLALPLFLPVTFGGFGGGCVLIVCSAGMIDVINVRSLSTKEVVATETGAHTVALDRKRSKLYAFLPRSHRAAVFIDAD